MLLPVFFLISRHRQGDLSDRRGTRLGQPDLHQIGIEFWDLCNLLSAYYDGSTLISIYLAQDPYAQLLPHLQIQGVSEWLPSESEALAEKLSVPMTSTIGQRSADFYTVLADRASRCQLNLNGTRKDWIIEYPTLRDWKSTTTSAQTLHCEVKLALHISLYYHREAIYIIGVSKNPCSNCETWFTHWNDLPNNNNQFIIPPSHRKVYSGWKLSGLQPLDAHVVSTVWASVDDLIARTEHAHHTDTIIPLYREEGDNDIVSTNRQSQLDNVWLAKFQSLSLQSWYVLFISC